MSRLILVRHGQASHTADDYDQLSELGYRQATLLGEQWAAEGLTPDTVDAVYIGPCKRHRQTAETLIESVGGRWPEPRFLDGFDEHDGYAVVMHSIPRLAETDEWVAARERTRRESEGKVAQRAYFDLFKHITRLWALERLELDGAGFEPWREFRRRVEGALAQVLEAEGRGKTVVVFTSAGPVSVAAAHALGLDDEGTMKLSWLVNNISVTELVWADETTALKSFNALPRLAENGLKTLV